jgi:8-oxo-dGTP pyrophosphatase MutT (NUDIX family)
VERHGPNSHTLTLTLTHNTLLVNTTTTCNGSVVSSSFVLVSVFVPCPCPPPSYSKSGCVPVRRDEHGDWQVLLVQSRWTPAVWLFPKGTVESGELAKEAAVRETREEAGVAGILGPKLGSWYSKGTDQKLKIWLLFVSEQYPASDKRWKERKKRLREWHTFDSAHRKMTIVPEDVARPELADVLETARLVLTHVSGCGANWKADLAAVEKDTTALGPVAALPSTGSSEDSDYRES